MCLALRARVETHKGLAQVGSSLACKYWTMVKVTDSDEHKEYRINYSRNKFYDSWSPCESPDAISGFHTT